MSIIDFDTKKSFVVDWDEVSNVPEKDDQQTDQPADKETVDSPHHADKLQNLIGGTNDDKRLL